MPTETAPVAPPRPLSSPEAPRLRPVLGVWFGVAVAVGSMIGAGIFRAPADVARELPSPWLFLGAWVTGGLYALLGTNIVAELATMLPRAGGQYVYARHTYGRYVGFLVGWNDWISCCGSVAGIAIVTAESLGALVPALAARGTAVALALSLGTFLVLARSVRVADRSQRATSLLKAVVLLLLVGACLTTALRHGVPAGASPARAHGAALVAAFVVALQGIIYAYDGWVGIGYFSEEAGETARDVPRALFGGVLAVIALYLLLNVAFLAVLPIGEMAAAPLVAASAASRIAGAAGGTIVQLLIVLCLPSALVANLLMASRVAFALAREGDAPAGLTRVAAGGAPTAALALSAVVTALFVLSGTFERVAAVCAFFFVASYAITFSALFVLRRREPDAPRPYRAWGHPFTTGIAFLGSVAFLVGVLVADPRSALITLAVIAVSWPVWWVLNRRRRGA